MNRLWVGRKSLLVVLLGAVVSLVGPRLGQAQQRIGYVDTEYILNQMPEYATVQQKLDRLEKQWRSEIQKQRERVQKLEREFEARRVLYTEAERKRQRKTIEAAKSKVERLRQRYFGPDGELYSRQQELMRPLQERVLAAVEDVATEAGYDYVLDKKGETLFLYARDEHDLNEQVLRELGVATGREDGRRSGGDP